MVFNSAIQGSAGSANPKAGDPNNTQTLQTKKFLGSVLQGIAEVFWGRSEVHTPPPIAKAAPLATSSPFDSAATAKASNSHAGDTMIHGDCIRVEASNEKIEASILFSEPGTINQDAAPKKADSKGVETTAHPWDETSENLHTTNRTRTNNEINDPHPWDEVTTQTTPWTQANIATMSGDEAPSGLTTKALHPFEIITGVFLDDLSGITQDDQEPQREIRNNSIRWFDVLAGEFPSDFSSNVLSNANSDLDVDSTSVISDITISSSGDDKQPTQIETTPQESGNPKATNLLPSGPVAAAKHFLAPLSYHRLPSF